jgi:Ca2+-binding EF-hand superfamily protein
MKDAEKYRLDIRRLKVLVR